LDRWDARDNEELKVDCGGVSWLKAGQGKYINFLMKNNPGFMRKKVPKGNP
jgi:hypothetical protein